MTKSSNLARIKKWFSFKIFWDDLKSLIHSYKWQMIWICLLSGFLLFLLNILLWISCYWNTLKEWMKDKLWMYFYIRENQEDQEKIYKQVFVLKSNLESQWLKVNFLSKDDAFDFMKKRIPELTWSLEKFWITNPLPATLYVTFTDNSQYEVLKSVMSENRNIIMNIQDFDQKENLQQQENRIINVIRLSNFVQLLSTILIIVITSVIVSFAIFFLRTVFNAFLPDIQVKKLLWATKSQIILPFLLVIVLSIVWWFIISLVLTLVSLWTFDYYMSLLFSFTLSSHLFTHSWYVVLWLLLELIVTVWLLMGLSYCFISRLHKKLK